MSTRQRSRPAVASAVHTEWPHMVSAFLLLAVTVPLTGFLLRARAPLLLPSMSLIALAISAIVALAAWCLSSDRHGAGITLWDVSGLQPGCSAILNKCWSSDPCQRSQFDNRIRSVRPTDPDHATPSEARIVGHAPFRFKRGRSTPSSHHDRPGLGR
jgi:hypothetical protein